ncbi:MAG: hypothetical protein ACI9HK_006158, partial [Pirellulaceae bacterium]
MKWLASPVSIDVTSSKLQALAPELLPSAEVSLANYPL